MQIQDCPWEFENIGKTTVQLNYSYEDIYNSGDVRRAVMDYEYRVAKVPCGNMDCLLGLQRDGMAVMETQLHLSKDKDSFEKEWAKYRDFYGEIDFRLVTDDKGFSKMQASIDDNMFSTDRVSLDPSFGPHIGRQRYVTWMEREYRMKSASFWWVCLDKQDVGFMMIRIKNCIIDCLLNGLFTPFQRKGLGLLTPASPLLLSIMKKLDVDGETTTISSNNAPVVHLYNKLNFNIKRMTYVLASHVLPPPK